MGMVNEFRIIRRSGEILAEMNDREFLAHMAESGMERKDINRMLRRILRRVNQGG